MSRSGDIEMARLTLKEELGKLGAHRLYDAVVPLCQKSKLPLMILFLPTTLAELGVTPLMVVVLPSLASVIALTAIVLMS